MEYILVVRTLSVYVNTCSATTLSVAVFVGVAADRQTAGRGGAPSSMHVLRATRVSLPACVCRHVFICRYLRAHFRTYTLVCCALYMVFDSCLHACTCVCACVHKYECVHVSRNMNGVICTKTFTIVCICHVYVFLQVYTCPRTHAHKTHTHIYIHTYIHVYNTYTYINTYIHAFLVMSVDTTLHPTAHALHTHT
jgi:hypothetical protein